jgi:CRP-like cAMP-binding protein
MARCIGRGAQAPLRPEELRALAADLQARSLARGERVFAAGESSPGVVVVRSGALELAVRQGRRPVVVEVLRAGDVDGDLPLLLGMPVPYSARATAPTDVLFLPGERFVGVLHRHPAIAMSWLLSVAARLAASQQRLMDLLGLPLPAQLAKLLLAEEHDGVVALPQETLAAMLGVRRPALNRLLSDWAGRSWVRVGYGRVEVVDRAALSALCRG